MFCEIYIKHKKPMVGPDLVTLLRGSNLGTEIPTADAHARTTLYRGLTGIVSLFAHETVKNCFVIVRSVSYNASTFHLEGNSTKVSVETLLEAAQIYVVSHLLPALRKNSSARATLQSVSLFEDNGRETGLVGKLPGMGSLFKEQFDLSEIHSHLIVLLTAFISFRLGSKWDAVRDAEISLGIVVLYACINGLLKYLWRRHKLKFGFKWS